MKEFNENNFDKSKPEGQLKRVLRSSIFQKHYPVFRFTSLRDALKLTIDWFLEKFMPMPTWPDNWRELLKKWREENKNGV